MPCQKSMGITDSFTKSVFLRVSIWKSLCGKLLNETCRKIFSDVVNLGTKYYLNHYGFERGIGKETKKALHLLASDDL